MKSEFNLGMGEMSIKEITVEIEKLAIQMCILNTDLSEDGLIEFLDKHHIKEK